MLQELTANTGAAVFAIGSTLFFILVFAGVALRVFLRKSESYDSVARLPLEDAAPAETDEKLPTQREARTGGR